jgi:hypothetical protein
VRVPRGPHGAHGVPHVHCAWAYGGKLGASTHAKIILVVEFFSACVKYRDFIPSIPESTTLMSTGTEQIPERSFTHAEKKYTPKIIFTCVEYPDVPPCGHAQGTRGTPRAPWGEVSPLTHAEKILSPLWRFACVALTGTGPRCAYPPSVCGYFILWAQLLVAHTRRDNTLAQRTESATAVCVPLNFPKPSRQ